MNSISDRTWWLAVVLAAAPALAEEPWETVQTDPVVVKTRKRAGTDVKEVLAEGTMAATPQDVQAAVTDVKRFTQFMPYMTEARVVEEADGGVYTYSKLDLPVLSSRDFVHLSHIDRDAATDPEGVFANHWDSAPDKVPRRSGVVRLVLSEGSWLVKPAPGGKSRVEYRFAVDPGGSVPTFMINRSNASGVADTFKNVEREAQRRARERTP